jgi:hypothetical protein
LNLFKYKQFFKATSADKVKVLYDLYRMNTLHSFEIARKGFFNSSKYYRCHYANSAKKKEKKQEGHDVLKAIVRMLG